MTAYTARSWRESSTLSHLKSAPLEYVWILRILSFARTMQPTHAGMPKSSLALTLANGSS